MGGNTQLYNEYRGNAYEDQKLWQKEKWKMNASDRKYVENRI
jgi:hypothetical protein